MHDMWHVLVLSSALSWSNRVVIFLPRIRFQLKLLSVIKFRDCNVLLKLTFTVRSFYCFRHQKKNNIKTNHIIQTGIFRRTQIKILTIALRTVFNDAIFVIFSSPSYLMRNLSALRNCDKLNYIKAEVWYLLKKLINNM